MNSRTNLTIIVALTILVVGFGVWMSKSNRSPKGPADAPETQTSSQAGTASVAPANSGDPMSLPQPRVTGVPNDATAVNPDADSASPGAAAVGANPTATSTNLILDWEDKIEDLLSSDIEDKAAAKQMIAMFPRLPEDGQVDAAQHISNLLPDEDYPEVAKLLNDPNLPEDVLDELFMDLLNRPHSILLPELLEIMKQPKHPIAEEAKDFLELYLEDDFGTDWNTWSAKIKLWIAENPD